MTCPHAIIVPYRVLPDGSVDGRCATCGDAGGWPIFERLGWEGDTRPDWPSTVPRIAVVGSRSLHPAAGPHLEARAFVRELIATLGDDAVVVSGGARGPDRWAVEDARARGLSYVAIPALWSLYERGAGPERNGWLVRSCDALVAVWDGRSSGTADVVSQARATGLRVRVEVFGQRPG